VWLPSHIGIKGNELAGGLAGAAAAATVKPDIDINIGLELSEAYNLVDRLASMASASTAINWKPSPIFSQSVPYMLSCSCSL